MSIIATEKSKILVLDASGTRFNKRDYELAERLWSLQAWTLSLPMPTKASFCVQSFFGARPAREEAFVSTFNEQVEITSLKSTIAVCRIRA